jgi:transposase
MANHLEMAMIHSILTLHRQGWSQRRIALELGLNRETVGRHLALAGSKPANAEPNPPLGAAGLPEGVEESKPATAAANPPLGAEGGVTGVLAAAVDVQSAGAQAPGAVDETGPARTGPISDCEPYRAVIQEKLNQGLSGQRIYQDLAGDENSPSYDSVKRFLRNVLKTTVLPFRRMEAAPGQESQVDFGSGAPVVGPGRKKRRTHVIRVVLSCSRKAYSEAVYRQTTDDFLACLENAFWALGGMTRTVIIDNLRAAVKHPDWFDPELNPRVDAFCQHYGIVILPSKPYTPRHKGKVERGIGYVKDNGLKGREFASLAEQNQHLREWEKGVADTRIHGTTRQHVGKVFEELERPALLPLPAERFPFFHEELRRVGRDGHVAVAKSYYSVPPEYVGREIWARWDGHLVKIFNHRHVQIAVHARQELGRFATAPGHIPTEKTSKVEKGTTWLLQQTALLGQEVGLWSQAMLQARGIPGVRVLVGLLALARRHPGSDLDRACRIASSHQAYRLRAIRELLQRGGPEQTSFEFLESHPIIRGLHEYDALVKDALRGIEPASCAEAP